MTEDTPTPDLIARTLTCPMSFIDKYGPRRDETVTIRDNLVALLAKLWDEEDGFSGKRPYGDSCWESDFYKALAAAGIIDGTLDEDGYLDECDWDTGDALIVAAIQSLAAA